MKRKLSLALAFIAFAGIPFLAYWLGKVEINAQVQQYGWACGTPIFALYFRALLLSGVVSACSLALGALAYRKLPKPRPTRRKIELMVVALPLMLALGVWAALLVAGV